MIRIRASALIVENKNILAVKHRKNGRQYYLLPGGGVDYGEKIKTALEREIHEELGVSAEAGKLLFVAESIHPKKERHIISMVLECCLYNHNFNQGQDNRVVGYEFLSLKKLFEVTFYPDFRNHIVEYVEKGKTGKNLLTLDWQD